jgi:hypothetical protein
VFAVHGGKGGEEGIAVGRGSICWREYEGWKARRGNSLEVERKFLVGEEVQ